MKSITSRIQEITDIGKVEEDGTTFSNVAKALNSIGIAAVDAQGQLRPLQEILNELGPMWATLDRNHQAYIATVLAGNRQQSRFIALMDNYDRAMELVDISQNAAGNSAQQLRAYNTGLEASFTDLSNAWQQFATNVADSTVITEVVDIITDLVNIVNSIPTPLIRAITYFVALQKALQLISRIKASDIFGSITNFLFTSQGADGKKINIFTSVLQTFDKLIDRSQDVKKELQDMFNGVSSKLFTKETKKAEKGVADITQSTMNLDAANKSVATSQNIVNASLGGQATMTASLGTEASNTAKKQDELGESILRNEDIMNKDDTTMNKQIIQTRQLAAAPSEGKLDPIRKEAMLSNAMSRQSLLDERTSLENSFGQRVRERISDFTSSNFNEASRIRNDFLNNPRTGYGRKNGKKGNSSGIQLDANLDFGMNADEMVSYFYYARDHSEAFKKYSQDLIDIMGKERRRLTRQMNANKEVQRILEDTSSIIGDDELVQELEEIINNNSFSKFDKNKIVQNTNALQGKNSVRWSQLGNISNINQIKGFSLNKQGLTIPQSKKSVSGAQFSLGENKDINPLWDLLGGNNTGRFEKISQGFQKVGSVASKAGSAIFTAFAGKEITSAIGQMIGLNEEVSDGIGNMVGFTAAGAKFGIKGMVIGATIGAIVTAFDAFTVSAEEARKKLEEINEQQDELTTKSSSISGALETYKELSTQIGLSEDEQQELNGAAEQLAELIPGAIEGYDQLGNAIINTAAAQAELNDLQEQQVDMAKKEMDTLGQLQEAEDGWDATRWLNEGLPWNWGNEKTFDEIQLEDRIGVAEEYRADITDYFTTLRDSLSQDLEAEEQELFNSIANGFQQAVSKKIFTTDKEENLTIDEAAEEYSNLLNSLASSVNLEDLSSKLREIEYIFESGEHSLEEASSVARKRLVDILSSAGYNSEEIDQIVNVVLNMTVEGAGAVVAAIEDIEEDISALRQKEDEGTITDYEKNRLANLEYIRDEINNTDIEVVTFLSNLGLLNEESINVIKELGGFGEIASMLQDENGELNIGNNYMELRNKLLGERNRLEKERENMQGKTTSLEDMPDATNFVSNQEGHKGPAGLGVWDSQYGNAMEALYKQSGGKSFNSVKDIENEFGEDWFFSNTMILDEEAQEEMLKMYNKWLKTSDVAKELEDKTKALTGIDGVLSKLVPKEIPEYSFRDMQEQLDSTISVWSEIYDTINKIGEQGGTVYADDLSSIFGVLDGLEQQMLDGAFDTEVWASNMQTLANGFSMVNGQLQLTTEGQGALVALQEESTRASYRQMLADLEATEAQLTNKKTLLQAYRSALVATLESLEKEKDGKYSETEAEKTMASALGEYLAGQEWAQVQTTQDALNERLELYGSFFTELEKMQIQAKNGEDITWKDVQSDYKNQYNSIISSVEDRYKKSIITADRDETIANLKNEIANVDGAIAAIDQQLNTIQVKKKLAEYLASASTDYGKFVNGAKEDTEDATDAQKDYNEQLERTLTLIEKIQGLQHTMDENETFMDLWDNYDGEKYAKLMMTNLDLAKQQYAVYKDLFAMQQEMTDQAAGDLLDSPYGNMFQIQENGDIGWSSDAMYDKYKGLPDEMQEDIDNLVQAFQEQRDELRDTELELANYAKALKDAQQAVVDLTIEAEDTIVEALKNRESIMHEARKKALEDEIDMIEKAVEARQKAQEQQEDASGVYDAQEALRRATLDSSGKNNAQLLQLQQDLEDKQKEISEKRFEDDMDDRKQWLQDTIDAEQETYDYRLEMMTWYWEQVQVIMEQSTEYIMQFLIQWDEEYRQVSATQQEQLRQQWEFTFTQLKTITEMLDEPIINLKNNLSNVTAEVQNMNVNVQALPGSWNAATAAANNYYEAAKRAASVGGYSGGGYSGGNSGGGSGGKGSGNKKTEDTDKRPAATFKVGDKVRSSEQMKDGGLNWVQQYKIDGKGSTNAIAGWGGNWAFGGNSPMKVIEVKYKNGMYYYMLENNRGTRYGYFNGHQLQYKTGGLVDYTGPAWVDGTSSKPEAFLNPYQTEQIGALADVLDTNSVKNFANNSNVTFGSINFNVASMSSAADGKKALEVFVKGANDLMAKKGVGTKLNLNVK